MTRLADYFLIVGYNFDNSKNGTSDGKILQKFPQKDWEDYPYEFAIERFCQPCGWFLTRSKMPPFYVIAYFTSTEGNPYYCACLNFQEAVPKELVTSEFLRVSTQGSMENGMVSPNITEINCVLPPSASSTAIASVDDASPDNTAVGGDKEAHDPNLIRPAELYAEKCIVLLARHEHFDVLRNCLNLIYTVYMDSLPCSLEHMVGNILASVDVPPTGGPRLTFTIGAGDRQVIQPAMCSTLPVTKSCVAMLFKHLGIQNVICLFSALLNDQNILICSRSYTRLTDACHALSSLLYPLKYNNVYIPILPISLLEMLNAPTPFLVGLHSSFRPDLSDLTDVHVADLDFGSVILPNNQGSVARLPEPFNSSTCECLTRILNPELLTADQVYPPEPGPPPDPEWQDKRLRAVFIRLFSQLFSGYRSCLVITRINPKLVIDFNKNVFLLLRGLGESDDFISRLLDTMAFSNFIDTRGPPFRVCDVFDEEYNQLPELFRQERNKPELVLDHIDKLAKKLYDNEKSGQPIIHQLPPLASKAHLRIHQSPFPKLDTKLVEETIQKAVKDKDKRKSYEQPEPRFVPHGPELDKKIFRSDTLQDKAKVIKEFVANIFNNHITEALKRRNTIRQDIKMRLIRRIFVDELYLKLHPEGAGSPDHQNHQGDNTSNAILTSEQFDLVIDLLEEALLQEEQSENSGVAAIIMELSTDFCTQLNNVRYFAHMTDRIQRHKVWERMSFWNSTFSDCVNNQLSELYIFQTEQIEATKKSTSRQRGESISNAYTSKMSTLDIAAEELKRCNAHTPDNLTHLKDLEESTVKAQILHFLNLIISFRIPLKICEKENSEVNDGTGNHLSSHMDGRQNGFEINGFESKLAFRNKLEMWLKKFVEKVGSENHLSSHSIGEIHGKIADVVDYHIMNLESIFPEVKNQPKFKKPEVTNPTLFPNEVAIRLANNRKSLSCQLLLDGRFERVEWQKLRENDPCLQEGTNLTLQPSTLIGAGNAASSTTDFGPMGIYADEIEDPETIRPLLPAQGAIFITNYRIIFRGAPRDPYQSNKLVCRSFPISSLIPLDKPQTVRVAAHQSASGSKEESQILILRSTTCQLLKIGFDPDEVTSSLCEEIRDRLHRLRYPLSLDLSFNPAPSNLFTAHHYDTVSSPGSSMGGTLPMSRSGGQIGEHSTAPPGGPSYDDAQRRQRNDDSESSSRDQAPKKKEFTKSATLRHAAMNTLSNTMQLIKPRSSSSKDRSPLPNRRNHFYSQSDSERSSMVFDEEMNKELDLPGHIQVTTDTKTLERLQCLPGYQEYQRMKLAIFPGSSNSSSMDPHKRPNSLKIVINMRYEISKTYPAMFVIPKDYPEHHLQLFAQTHRQKRIPIVTWRHPHTGALLLRGSSFRAKNPLGMLKQHSKTSSSVGHHSEVGWKSSDQDVSSAGQKDTMPGAQSSNGSGTMTVGLHKTLFAKKRSGGDSETSRSKQQEAYFRHLVDISPNPEEIHVLDPLVPWDASHTPKPHKKRMIDRALKTLRHSGGKAKAAFALKRSVSRGDSIHEDGPVKDSASGTMGSGSNLQADTASISTVNTSIVPPDLRSVPLYVLGEKAEMKSLRKSEHFHNVDFIPVDFVSKSHLKESFSKLYQVCLPVNQPAGSASTGGAGSSSAAGTGAGAGSGTGVSGLSNFVGGSTKHHGKSFHAELQDCPWLNEVRGLLELAGAVVDLLDIQQASVAVCLEEGWDATCQIVSLAQVMLDPEYRTIKGFWALIEKDWLQVGHRFGQRSSQTSVNKSSGFSPVFLMFLDAVHQLVYQFPLAFEFNTFYLEFLAYHHVSNRFPDFKFDCEAERVCWLLGDERYSSVSNGGTGAGLGIGGTAADSNSAAGELDSVVGSGAGSCAFEELSIWTYIQKQHDEWPVFFNFRYNHDLTETEVLRPSTCLPTIRIWDYYLNEDLHTGSIYDLDQFCPAYRNKTSVVYEPLLRHGFNNSHVEFMYAVLGLKEGDDADNWRSLWRQACDSAPGLCLDENLGSCASDPSSHLSAGTGFTNGVGGCLECMASCYTTRDINLRVHRRTSLNKLDRRRSAEQGSNASSAANASGHGAGAASGAQSGSGALATISESSGGMDNSSSMLFANPHHFQTLGITIPKTCSYCHQLIVPTKKMVSCTVCHYVCHEKCAPFVPKTCQQPAGGGGNAANGVNSNTLSSVSGESRPDDKQSANLRSTTLNPAVNSSASSQRNSHPSSPIMSGSSDQSSQPPPTPSSNADRTRDNVSSPSHLPPASNGGFRGVLYKQDHRKILPQWKQRHFVLDSLRHQLLYFETENDVSTRGTIDLQHVRSVRTLKNVNGGQRRFPENAFIEVKTVNTDQLEVSTRTYRFAADDSKQALEWVERIKALIS